jgi:hypothetical protein
MNVGYDNYIDSTECDKVEFIEGISFNGGTSNSHEYTVTRSTTSTITSSIKLDEEIVTGLKLGSTEITCGLNISIGETFNTTTTESTTETIGYTFSDDDQYDAINMKCYQDLVFGTLLFISENSVTSNPWEKQTSSLLGVSLNPAGTQNSNIRTNEQAGFRAMVSNLNTNENVAGVYNIFIPSNLNPSHVRVKINGKNDEEILAPHGGSTEIGISAEYDPSTYGDTSMFAVVAQASNDYQVGDTLYYTVIWDYVVPPVEFMYEKDPYDHDIQDSLTNLNHPAFIWGESSTEQDPDSVILYSRLKGNYIWDRIGKMDEYMLEGASHNYFRYEYYADSETDTCIMEFEMTAYKGDEARNSLTRFNLQIIPLIGVGIDEENNIDLPKEFSLQQNYPNPFNPYTTISYAIPEPTGVRLSIYDISGSLIKTVIEEDKNPGIYDVEINASAYPSGLYIYCLKTNDHILSKKMLLLK